MEGDAAGVAGDVDMRVVCVARRAALRNKKRRPKAPLFISVLTDETD